MSIIASDLKVFLSGGALQADPNASLGGVESAVEVVDDTLNNLFHDVSGAEHSVGDVNYRCVFIKNTNAIDTAQITKLYISQNTPSSEDTIEIGLDLTGKGNLADTIQDETTAPDPAVTFVDVSTYNTALELGDLTPGESYPIWIKRTVVSGTTPTANNNFILVIACDTL